MKFINNLSIPTKIVLLIVTISTINIIAASIYFLNYEKRVYDRDIVNRINILAEIVGENNTVTMLFGYKQEAEEDLTSLKKDKYILKVQLIKEDNSEFAVYTSENNREKFDFAYPVTKDTVVFYDDVAIINKIIVKEDELVGAVRLKYSLNEYSKKVENYTEKTAMILFASVFLSLILAFIFQKIITKSIFSLNNTMNEISTKKDYSIRSKINTKDEIGKLSEGFEETESGLRYKIIQKGDGTSPEKGQTVAVHYKGMFSDGNVFDDSYKRGAPIEFPIGQGNVIPGWDEGIMLLNVGDKARFVIPSSLAYGEAGAGGVIPPNATLVFDVELMDVK